MKTILSLMLGLATLASAQTNESILFTAHLTGNTSYFGDGTFSLIGNLLSYHVRTDFGFSQAAIYGPAQPGSEGPLIFNLTLTGCQVPQGDREGFCGFFSRPPVIPDLVLSEQQTTDLLAGLWYVRAVAPGAPSFPIQGQILQVPEPSPFSIFLIFASLFFVRWVKKSRANARIANDARTLR